MDGVSLIGTCITRTSLSKDLLTSASIVDTTCVIPRRLRFPGMRAVKIFERNRRLVISVAMRSHGLCAQGGIAWKVW